MSAATAAPEGHGRKEEEGEPKKEQGGSNKMLIIAGVVALLLVVGVILTVVHIYTKVSKYVHIYIYWGEPRFPYFSTVGRVG